MRDVLGQSGERGFPLYRQMERGSLECVRDRHGWSRLGSRLGGTYLYAGGYFHTAGGVAANKIARWDGAVWSPLQTGMNGNVTALAWDGSNLYAGGDFTAAGGVLAQTIAKWDGAAWSPLQTGMAGNVNALALDGTSLFAGGNFTDAGGLPSNYIARWNGTNWSALGTGTNYPVLALAFVRNSSGQGLYAGGAFSVAGNKPSYHIARWTVCVPPTVTTVTKISDPFRLKIDTAIPLTEGWKVYIAGQSEPWTQITVKSPTQFVIKKAGDFFKKDGSETVIRIVNSDGCDYSFAYNRKAKTWRPL